MHNKDFKDTLIEVFEIMFIGGYKKFLELCNSK
jgi:hypothetical protein